MQKFKQWVKDNQDLIALGALVGMATAATIGVVVITKKHVATQNLIALGALVGMVTAATIGVVVITRKTVATQNRIASPFVPPAKNPLPEQFQDHDYAGLLSVGQKGDLWAHIDSDPAMEPFKIGHIDFENKMAYYSEYPHAGPCPEALGLDPTEIGLDAAKISLIGAADPVTGAVSDAAMETARLAANEAMLKASQ